MDSILNMMGLLIFAMLVGSGGYAIYTYARLRRQWGFFPNKFLLPANCPAEECLDGDGYLSYISPRLLIFGVLCIVCGILYLPVMLPNLGILLGLEGTLSTVYSGVVPMLGFGVFIWYMVCQTKASRKFWN